MVPGTEIPPAVMLRGPFCLARDVFLLLPRILGPAQLHYLQGTLLPHLNNPVSSLNMQNTLHNLANHDFLRIWNCFILAAAAWEDRDGVTFASTPKWPCFRVMR